MSKKMILTLYLGGVHIEKELFYKGETPEEIIELIAKDENELLEYMRTGNNNGSNCFCFCGFMFEKEKIIAAQLAEPDFWEE